MFILAFSWCKLRRLVLLALGLTLVNRIPRWAGFYGYLGSHPGLLLLWNLLTPMIVGYPLVGTSF